MSLKVLFAGISFVLLAPLVCLGTAVAGALCAADTGGAVGFVRYLGALAVSFLWMFLAVVVLSHADFSHSPAGLAVYALWGVSSVAPFCFSLCKRGKNNSKIGLPGAIWGVVTVLISSVISTAVIYYVNVKDGVLLTDRLFQTEYLDDICIFFLLPVCLVFLLVFALTALGLGGRRKWFFGVIENLLLLAISPAGIFVGMFVSFWCELFSDCGGSGNASMSIFLAVWLLCVFGPYGYMTLRGWRKKDELGFYNGIAGLGAVVFFLAGLGLLGNIGRGV